MNRVVQRLRRWLPGLLLAAAGCTVLEPGGPALPGAPEGPRAVVHVWAYPAPALP